MLNPSFTLRELFHLVLLQHLSLRLSGRAYAVKGGICLRFFHMSQRLSEDMDLDVISQIRLKTLANAVDGILQGNSLPQSLMPHGVTRLTHTKPKQTETTQRWKIALHTGTSACLNTKVEFSRRKEHIVYASGIPGPAILQQYKIPPFATQYYNAEQMCAQKISALASPSRNAARDLFDLHHLLHGSKADKAKVSKMITKNVIENAVQKIETFTYKDFGGQVIPYLTEGMIDLYRDSKRFFKLKGQVEDALLGMII
ncbi:nucleotidyl transferase AbiEii/AbiGii toxin family protein [Elusimicrobiota bacterium]